MEALLNVVENAAGNCTKADDAEQYVIDELRKMGNDALHCWADMAVDKAVEQTREQQPELHGNGKKSLLAHDLWRNIGHRASISLSWPTTGCGFF